MQNSQAGFVCECIKHAVDAQSRRHTISANADIVLDFGSSGTTKNPAQNFEPGFLTINGGEGQDRTVDTWFFSELLPAFQPARQTTGGSPHYYGVQTISSTQGVVRRVVVTGSSRRITRSLPSVLSFPFFWKWEFHRYSLMQSPPSPTEGAMRR